MRAYLRTRDALSPAVLLAPFFGYFYVYRPLVRLRDPDLRNFFPDQNELILVHIANLLFVGAFLLGASLSRRPPGKVDHRFSLVGGELTARKSRQLIRLGVACGAAANMAVWMAVYASGGIGRLLRVSKPFLDDPINVGYFRELPMLTFPGLLLVSLAWRGRPLTGSRIATLIFIALPQLLIAVVGARRGPTFLIVCALFGCWCVIKRRFPKLHWTLTLFALLGILMLELQERRNRVYFWWLDNEPAEYQVTSEEKDEAVSAADEYIFGSGLVLLSHANGTHHWGRRYFTIFLVRPVPRALWPTKYEDLGVEWMERESAYSGFTAAEWAGGVGFVPPRGSAPGLVADVFLEFSWGGILLCFLIGRFYDSAWSRWTSRGGVWTVIYLELLMLSVYLPSQSLGAWGYRAILLIVPSWLLWKRVIAAP